MLRLAASPALILIRVYHERAPHYGEIGELPFLFGDYNPTC
jgi:hypothetical protein